ncbi:hypothetical protein HY948_02345 [Candidatus Gottesmanbacteria bacterium]|nr:hypothetical protein [Candidatus Gottesmanbacteria bacterium]
MSSVLAERRTLDSDHLPLGFEKEVSTPLILLKLRPGLKISIFHFPYNELATTITEFTNETDGQIDVLMEDDLGQRCYGRLTYEGGQFASWSLTSWTDSLGNWTNWKEQTDRQA